MMLGMGNKSMDTYGNATEMVENYAAIRRRLRNPPIRKPVEIIPEAPSITPEQQKERDEYAGLFMMLVAFSGLVDKRPGVMRRLKEAVGRRFGVTVAEINSKSRLGRLVVPRQVVMILARHFTRLSMPQIGRALGRDHTTILYGVRKLQPVYERINSDLPPDASLDQWVAAFKEALVPA